MLNSIAFGGSIFNPVADFSSLSDPNNAWVLGTEATLGGPITLFSAADLNCVSPGYEVWWSGSGCIIGPFVGQNNTGGVFAYSGTGGELFQQTTELNVHPGFTMFTVVEWTAPVADNYTIDGFFSGLDIKPTTTDVHVLINGVDVFDANIAEFGLKHSFSFSPDLLAGATVDFIVGNGFGGDAQNDSTGLSVTITGNPEPGPATLVGLGGAIILAVRRRKLGQFERSLRS
jgi:hypothetical protein